MVILKGFLRHTWREKSTIVAFVSSFSTNIMYLAIYQFSTLIFKQSFVDNDESQDYISDRLSIYFFIAPAAVLIPDIIFGFITDKVKVWTLVFGNHAVMLISLVIFILSMPSDERIYTPDNP